MNNNKSISLIDWLIEIKYIKNRKKKKELVTYPSICVSSYLHLKIQKQYIYITKDEGGGEETEKERFFFKKKFKYVLVFFLENRFRLHHHSSRTDSDMSMYRYRTQLKDIYISSSSNSLTAQRRGEKKHAVYCTTCRESPLIVPVVLAPNLFFFYCGPPHLSNNNGCHGPHSLRLLSHKVEKKNEWKKTSRCSTCAMIRELQLSVPFILNRTSNWLIFINF